jgi:hypothetical protein
VVDDGRNPTVLCSVASSELGQLLLADRGRPCAVCASLGLLTNADELAVPVGAYLMQLPLVPLLTPRWSLICAWMVPIATVAAAASGAGPTVAEIVVRPSINSTVTINA